LVRTIIPDHRRILDHVIANDPDGARRAMREHVEHARSIQLEVLARRDGGPQTDDTPAQSHAAN
jgi:DNA-binding GntR family transcriptional regulator